MGATPVHATHRIVRGRPGRPNPCRPNLCRPDPCRSSPCRPNPCRPNLVCRPAGPTIDRCSRRVHRAMDQCRRETRHTLATPDRTEPLGTVALHRDRPGDGGRQIPLHLVAHRGANFGRSHTTEQSTLPTPAIRPRRASPRRGAAAPSSRRPSTAGSVSGKCLPMSPRPAAPSSASAHGMGDRIGVAVTRASPGSPSKRARRRARAIRSRIVAEAMDVEALPDPESGTMCVMRWLLSVGDDCRRAHSRSSGWVILRLSWLAGDHDHAAADPPRRARRRRWPRHRRRGHAAGLSARKACGVCTATRVDRSGRRHHRAVASTTLMVSVTATPGIAPSAPAATASMTRREEFRRGERARGVVHADDRRRRRARRPARRGPIRCGSRHRPPHAVAQRRRRRPARRPRRRRTPPRRGADAIDPARAFAERSYCFGPPNRWPLPAGDHDRSRLSLESPRHSAHRR